MGTREKGFTLIELTSAMTAGAILVVSFASILVLSTKQSSAIGRRVALQQDVIVLNGYIREQLLNMIGDSLLIYTDTTAENNGITSNSGSIITTEDIDGNQYRLALSNQHLDWQKNGLSHQPVDAEVLTLNFQKRSSSIGKRVDLSITFFEEEDTVTNEWILVFRN